VSTCALEKDGLLLADVIQLIFIYALPGPGQSWAHYITSSFDIDIVKGIARIDSTEHLGEINFEEETLKHVQAAKFDYLIQPCIAFDKHLKRV
jgi:hypothetical protein